VTSAPVCVLSFSMLTASLRSTAIGLAAAIAVASVLTGSPALAGEAEVSAESPTEITV
jgi:hypothetical protein